MMHAAWRSGTVGLLRSKHRAQHTDEGVRATGRARGHAEDFEALLVTLQRPIPDRLPVRPLQVRGAGWCLASGIPNAPSAPVELDPFLLEGVLQKRIRRGYDIDVVEVNEYGRAILQAPLGCSKGRVLRYCAVCGFPDLFMGSCPAPCFVGCLGSTMLHSQSGRRRRRRCTSPPDVLLTHLRRLALARGPGCLQSHPHRFV